MQKANTLSMALSGLLLYTAMAVQSTNQIIMRENRFPKNSLFRSSHLDAKPSSKPNRRKTAVCNTIFPNGTYSVFSYPAQYHISFLFLIVFIPKKLPNELFYNIIQHIFQNLAEFLWRIIMWRMTATSNQSNVF